MKDIKLQSRYHDAITTFKPINENSGVLLSNGHYVRTTLSQDNTKIEAVDFEGGPMLYVGNELEDTGKKIKSIKACYYVELE